ncbi:Basic form of pathogenesis-related protein 1 [Sesamum angolense]|uniref:Basic form of pathogenesis-related protein 1 n=1 Tax=Sesamum angolense TaxID=2727404 RepID=A0AAE2BXW3_9LAMI|nr:Basic form of pathogenesis-related protein 1 [Sesamum angolense]
MPINTKHLTLTFSSKSKSHFTYHHNGLSQNPPILVILSCIIIPSTAQNSAQDYVNAHNTARAQVGVGPVVWNTTLANCAQNYANQRVGDCSLTHSNGIFGENLAKGSSSSFSGVSAVNMWVAEKQCYDYNTNSCIGGKQCLHYTQSSLGPIQRTEAVFVPPICWALGPAKSWVSLPNTCVNLVVPE